MDPYEILGAKRDATADDIKTSYRRSASAAHPDHEQGSDARMAAVNEAYAILSDPVRRQQFDETGTTERPKSIDQEAMALLAQMLQGVLATDAEQVIATTREALAEMRQQIEVQRAQALNLQGRMKKKRDRVRTKDGKPNMVHTIIDQQVEGARRGIELCNHKLKVVSMAVQMLKHYEEDGPGDDGSTAFSFLVGAMPRRGTWTS